MSTTDPRTPRFRNKLPFAAIPHAVYGDRKLKPGDRDLLAVLTRYARDKTHCWPSNRRLAGDLGVSLRTVKYRLRRLETARWVACVKASKGRVIYLTWRSDEALPPQEDEDCPPEGQSVSRPPVQPIAPQGDRNRKEIQRIREDIGNTNRQTVPEQPASAPSAPRRRKDGMTTEEMEATVRRTNDPILAKELIQRTRPRPEPGPPPVSTGEMIARLHEDPAFVPKLAELLAQDFDDHKSWGGLHEVVERAWRAEISLHDVANAYGQAMGPKSENRGAVFMTALKRMAGRRRQA